MNKPILDACCGSRMFWFDKENENTIFMDNRDVETEELQYYVAVRRQYANREISFVVGKYDTPGKATCVFNVIMTALRHRCPVLYLPANNENFDTRMSILEEELDRGVY